MAVTNTVPRKNWRDRFAEFLTWWMREKRIDHATFAYHAGLRDQGAYRHAEDWELARKWPTHDQWRQLCVYWPKLSDQDMLFYSARSEAIAAGMLQADVKDRPDQHKGPHHLEVVPAFRSDPVVDANLAKPQEASAPIATIGEAARRTVVTPPAHAPQEDGPVKQHLRGQKGEVAARQHREQLEYGIKCLKEDPTRVGPDIHALLKARFGIGPTSNTIAEIRKKSGVPQPPRKHAGGGRPKGSGAKGTPTPPTKPTAYSFPGGQSLLPSKRGTPAPAPAPRERQERTKPARSVASTTPVVGGSDLKNVLERVTEMLREHPEVASYTYQVGKPADVRLRVVQEQTITIGGDE